MYTKFHANPSKGAEVTRGGQTHKQKNVYFNRISLCSLSQSPIDVQSKIPCFILKVKENFRQRGFDFPLDFVTGLERKLNNTSKSNFKTYQYQALGNPMMRMAHVRKLASQIANPTSRFEKEFLNWGLKSTLIDIRVPIRPKIETAVRATPST